MGACFDCCTYLTDNKESVKQQWAEDVRSSQHRNGTSYSGCIGMLGENLIFKSTVHDTLRQAEDFLSENHTKWEAGWAVPFRMTPQKEPSYVAKAREKVEKFQSKLDETRKKIIARIQNGKSKLISCKKCESKVSRKHISHHSTSCPVCNHSLTTDSEDKKIKNYSDKRNAANLELGRMEVKAAKSGKIGYICGGICPS